MTDKQGLECGDKTGQGETEKGGEMHGTVPRRGADLHTTGLQLVEARHSRNEHITPQTHIPLQLQVSKQHYNPVTH